MTELQWPGSDGDRTTLERARATGIRWVLLTGQRWLVAAGLVGLLAVSFTALVVTGLVPLRNVQALFYVYSALLTGNLTLITVVVSINQSLLSRYLLYAGVPTVAVAAGSLLLLTIPSGNPAATVDLRILVPVTFTIGLLPLTILVAVFVRTATITKLTAATLPFTTPEQER